MKRLNHNSLGEKSEIDEHDKNSVNEEQREKYGAMSSGLEGGEQDRCYVNTVEEQGNTYGNVARIASDTTRNELDGCYINTVEKICGEEENYSNAIVQEHIVVNKENDINRNKYSENNAMEYKCKTVDDLENEITNDSGICRIHVEISQPLSRLPNNETENNIGIENKSFSHSEYIVSDFETLRKGRDEVKPTGTNRSADGNGVCSMSIIEEAVDTESSKASIKSVDCDDVPTYLPPTAQVRSRRGAEIGSETLITNDDLLLAATLVASAMKGQKFDVKREPRYVRSYNYFNSIYLRAPLYVAIIVTLMLAIFEEPSVPHLQLPYWITMVVEGTSLLLFILRICHRAHWRVERGFKKDIKMIIAIACITITVIDMVAYVHVVELTNHKAVRWSRSLRPLLIMNFSDGTHLKRAWSNIRMTLKQIAHVIVLFYVLIVVFSLVAMKMFQYRTDMKFPDGSDYFKNYMESFWQLYILVTTANNPDVMMPAYDENRWYCLFFTIYIILCLYLMLNILLAVTYNSYRENMKNQIKHSAQTKRKILHQAFEVIKINVDGNEMVTYKTWKRLIRLAQPGKTKHQIDLLMMVLDTDRSGFISRHQFLNIADLLNVPISVVSERKNVMETYCKTIYMSKLSKSLRHVVNSMYFNLSYDGIVVINVILICLNVDAADWLFCSLYILEIILKWYTFGTKRYFYSFQNWSDVIITLLSLAVLIVKDFDFADGTSSETLSVLNVFRIFRILRCLIEFERFRIIFDAVFNVSFSILTYCGILFIVFYCFAILGMEVFAGKIEFLGDSANSSTQAVNCNNPALNGSVFYANRYCKINFNDVINSFVVLASLLVGNNWHVICNGFVLVTSKAARLYFMSFHLCVAVVVMNIVTAFILDMFMYEYAFSKKGYIDTKVEMTIKHLQLGIDDDTGMDITEEQKKAENKTSEGNMSYTKSMFRRLTMKQKGHLKPNLSRYDGIRFHMKKRGWTKTELLLQQLFELEEDTNDIDTDYEKIRMLNIS